MAPFTRLHGRNLGEALLIAQVLCWCFAIASSCANWIIMVSFKGRITVDLFGDFLSISLFSYSAILLLFCVLAYQPNRWMNNTKRVIVLLVIVPSMFMLSAGLYDCFYVPSRTISTISKDISKSRIIVIWMIARQATLLVFTGGLLVFYRKILQNHLSKDKEGLGSRV